MPRLSHLPLQAGSRADSHAVAGAVQLLAPRWALPDDLVCVALTDIAHELGVEVDSLAALVVATSRA